MKFGDKLKKLRKEKGITQSELAEIISVSLRTVTNYEAENRYPKKREIYTKLANYFEVDINYLLTENENFIIQATAEYGNKGTSQAKKIVDDATNFFAGGNLTDADKDELMRALQEAYWTAKKNNKKYRRKRYKLIVEDED